MNATAGEIARTLDEFNKLVPGIPVLVQAAAVLNRKAGNLVGPTELETKVDNAYNAIVVLEEQHEGDADMMAHLSMIREALDEI